jgi:hypothetical protein
MCLYHVFSNCGVTIHFILAFLHHFLYWLLYIIIFLFFSQVYRRFYIMVDFYSLQINCHLTWWDFTFLNSIFQNKRTCVILYIYLVVWCYFNLEFHFYKFEVHVLFQLYAFALLSFTHDHSCTVPHFFKY